MTEFALEATPIELRLLVVADDPLARAGLARVLDEQPDCRVLDQLGSGSELRAMFELRRPDAVVWDLGWEPSGNLESFAAHAEGGPPIIALLGEDSAAPAVRAAGARGLLPRDIEVERLLAAVRAVVEGLLVIDPGLAGPLPSPEGDEPPPPVEPLTPREIEVLQHLVEGISNRAIAQRLEISEHTVKFHVNAIFGKLGVQSRTEAAVRAARLGLVYL